MGTAPGIMSKKVRIDVRVFAKIKSEWRDTDVGRSKCVIVKKAYKPSPVSGGK